MPNTTPAAYFSEPHPIPEGYLFYILFWWLKTRCCCHECLGQNGNSFFHHLCWAVGCSQIKEALGVWCKILSIHIYSQQADIYSDLLLCWCLCCIQTDRAGHEWVGSVGEVPAWGQDIGQEAAADESLDGERTGRGRRTTCSQMPLSPRQLALNV